MSADNAIGVAKIAQGDYRVKMIFLSDDAYDFSDAPSYPTREAALVAAHDAHDRECVVEYGVMEIVP